jgi:serine protease Do
MLRLLWVLIFVGVSLPSFANTFSPSPAVIRAQEDFTKVAQRVNPWVVNISTSQTEIVRYRIPSFFDFFGESLMGPAREFKRQSLGSGLIISNHGQILTNAHVISGADEITVRLHNGEEYQATVLGEDESVDLAVLKIKPKASLSPAVLGDSDQVEVGQWAIALGNPFGYDHSMTVGVISAKNRSNVLDSRSETRYQNFLQTDAAINSGNSGGPLCNIHGEVIAINTAIITPNQGSIGLGFAIPINMVKRAIPDLIKLGRVVPPRLGFYTQNLDQQLAQALDLNNTRGVLVTDVRENMPADKAGLKRGDVITHLGGRPVTNESELTARLYELQSDQPVVVTVNRKGRQIGLRMIGDRPDPSENSHSWHGLSVVQATTAEARQRNLAIAAGVVITQVEKNSSAERAGLRVNDIILEINQNRVASLRDFKNLSRRFPDTQRNMILVIRGNARAYVVLEEQI